jgi:hypothetical protein
MYAYVMLHSTDFETISLVKFLAMFDPVHIHPCMYVCMYVCMYAYVMLHSTDFETTNLARFPPTFTQAYMHTQIHAHIHTYRQTEITFNARIHLCTCAHALFWRELTLSRLFFPSIIFSAMRSVTERFSEARPFVLEPKTAASREGEFDPDVNV